jgi:hypothetical protein
VVPRVMAWTSKVACDSDLLSATPSFPLGFALARSSYITFDRDGCLALGLHCWFIAPFESIEIPRSQMHHSG